MGSVGIQNPWAPYDSARECTPDVCSIYCPQFCYLIFPPPPPPPDDSGAATQFSPLIIAVIGVLASGFLLVGYYTLVARLCRRRNDSHNNNNTDRFPGTVFVERDRLNSGAAAGGGLDEAMIEKISVCKYEKGNGLIEGTDCAVCLSEFHENESLRLLPNCSHAFHLPCIDIWLRSNSTCPLCRADISYFPNPMAPPAAQPSVTANPYEFRRPEDVVFVIDDDRVVAVQRHHHRRREESEDAVGFGFSTPKRVLISDILKCDDASDECDRRVSGGIGSSEGFSTKAVGFMDRGMNSMSSIV